jgi:hypothetical protein
LFLLNARGADLDLCYHLSTHSPLELSKATVNFIVTVPASTNVDDLILLWAHT